MAVRDAYHPVVITFLVVDSIAVGLRFWARGLKKSIGYDDVTMAISLVGFVIFCTMELLAIDFGIGATAMEEGFDPLQAAKYFTIAQIVYILTTGISKVGVGLVLFRLATGSDMPVVRWSLVASMVVVAVFALTTALIYAFQCRPLSVAWGVGEGECISSTVLGNSGMALSVMDMTISWLYALMPIYMLHKAQIRLKLKISILLLLGFGAVSSVATIIRLKYAVQITRLSAQGGLAGADIVQASLNGTIYSIIEIALSIFAASLTALRPLLRKVPCFSDLSTGGHSNTRGFGSLNTYGNSGHTSHRDNRGPAFQLDDRHVSDADSQENIIPAKKDAITKQTDIKIAYTPKRSRGSDYATGNQW